MTKLLAVLALSLPLAAMSGEFETLRASSDEALKDAVASPAATAKLLPPAARPAPHALAGARVDLEAWFAAGSRVSKDDVLGWRAGRRLTPKGWAAALLIGQDIYDQSAGPASGSVFKLLVQGSDNPSDSPESYYDEMYPPKVEGIQSWVERTAADWSVAELTDAGAKTFHGPHKHEVRKYGDYLVVKYPSGQYGYFFKRVR